MFIDARTQGDKKEHAQDQASVSIRELPADNQNGAVQQRQQTDRQPINIVVWGGQNFCHQ